MFNRKIMANLLQLFSAHCCSLLSLVSSFTVLKNIWLRAFHVLLIVRSYMKIIPANIINSLNKSTIFLWDIKTLNNFNLRLKINYIRMLSSPNLHPNRNINIINTLDHQLKVKFKILNPLNIQLRVSISSLNTLKLHLRLINYP